MRVPRTVGELETGDDVWRVVLDWVATAADARVLPVDEARARRTLLRIQVTTSSVLGSLVRYSGGVLVDGGWLRLLGGGTDELEDVATANGIVEPVSGLGAPPYLVVAEDVLGGVFAVNGGILRADLGEICYWGPDTLDWTPLGVVHGGFVEWALTGSTEDFYADLRWPGWEEDVADLPMSHGLALHPPPFVDEVQGLSRPTRRPITLEELRSFYREVARQLGR